MFNFMRLPPLRRLMLMKAITGGGSWSTISGNLVSFTAKAAPLRQLEVAFSPVQSLNGYDNPWPAGGGKNKCPHESEWEAGYLNNSGTISTQGATLEKTSPFFSIDGLTGDLTFSCEGNFPSGATYAAWRGVCFYSTASADGFISPRSAGEGNVALTVTIPTGAKYARVSCRTYGNAIKPQVESGSSATSWTPYSNLCPISGWSSLTVEQRGKNLLNINSPDIVLAPKTVLADGVCSNGVIETRTAPWSFIINAYDSNGTSVLQTSTAFSGAGRISIPLTIPANAVSLFCRYSGSKLDCGFRTPIDITGNCVFSADVLSADMGTVGGLQIGNFMIELGSTASEYVPYNPSSRSISISLGETVYSGTVDVVTGVVTVDMAAVDMGTLNWAVISQAGEGVFSSTSLNGIIKPSIWLTEMFHGISTIYAPAIGADVYSRVKDNTIGADGNGRLYTFDPAKSGLDKNEYKTAMSGVTLCYELATPITIQLTPQEVQSLAGDNVLFSDANGDLTVTYRSN